jgi:hypothetical protein
LSHQKKLPACGNYYTEKDRPNNFLYKRRFIYSFYPLAVFFHKMKQIVLIKTKIMRSLLYIIAVILIIGWLVGVFAYSAGGLIHILIVLAVISILLAIIRRA